MSGTQGGNDNMAVVESFKEALEQRVGKQRFQLWFAHGVDFLIDHQRDPDATVVMLKISGVFALERIRDNLLSELRGAARQSIGSASDVKLSLQHPPAQQTKLPLADLVAPSPADCASGKPQTESRRRPPRAASRRREAQSFATLVGEATAGRRPAAGAQPVSQSARTGAATPTQLELPYADASDNAAAPTLQSSGLSGGGGAVEMTLSSFAVGPCNQLAHTAMLMACQDPLTASPLFVCGPTGTGKTHILSVIACQLRRHHRMRRVMMLSAEQFTNDFIRSVGGNGGGIASFRSRYREVEALLIDGIQFLRAKKSTLAEMLYTVETLVHQRRPLIVSGISPPLEIEGLTSELAGRLAGGIVCPLQPIDMATRETILRREIEHHCQLPMPDETIHAINATLAGDGRLIRGVAKLINLLQRMMGRAPTIDELRQHGGDLLRAGKPVATLPAIESAVCKAFQLPANTLRSGSQTRAVSEPRMLAMYLSRQLTASAYTEIARHFGGRSHSTAISAEKNVKNWLQSQKPIGRGQAAMSAQEAINRIECLLRTG